MCCRHTHNCISKSCVQVVEGSLSACQAICKQLLPPLATAASDAQSIKQEHGQYHRPLKTELLALSAILGIVKAAVKAVAAAAAASAESTMANQRSFGNDHMQPVDSHDEEDGEDPLAGTGAAVFDAITSGHSQRSSDLEIDTASVGDGTGQGLAGDLGGKLDGDAEMRDGSAATQDQSQKMQQLAGKVKGHNGINAANKGDDSGQDEIELLRLQVLTELVSFPAASSPLSAQVCCTQIQVSCILGRGSCKQAAAVFV